MLAEPERECEGGEERGTDPGASEHPTSSISLMRRLSFIPSPSRLCCRTFSSPLPIAPSATARRPLIPTPLPPPFRSSGILPVSLFPLSSLRALSSSDPSPVSLPPLPSGRPSSFYSTSYVSLPFSLALPLLFLTSHLPALVIYIAIDNVMYRASRMDFDSLYKVVHRPRIHSYRCLTREYVCLGANARR
ncbi:hypothetical protein B0H11DRAFT_262605 [Mycena galericulata]|nr:hypothetical protein B0H11DRAFT_262605 [Mycena galericulata]